MEEEEEEPATPEDKFDEVEVNEDAVLSTAQVSVPQVTIRRRNKGKSLTQKKMWTPQEKAAVLEFFKMNIKKSIVPGKKHCEKCIEQNHVLANRTWKNIKYCVKNHIQKNKSMK